MRKGRIRSWLLPAVLGFLTAIALEIGAFALWFTVGGGMEDTRKAYVAESWEMFETKETGLVIPAGRNDVGVAFQTAEISGRRVVTRIVLAQGAKTICYLDFESHLPGESMQFVYVCSSELDKYPDGRDYLDYNVDGEFDTRLEWEAPRDRRMVVRVGDHEWLEGHGLRKGWVHTARGTFAWDSSVGRWVEHPGPAVNVDTLRSETQKNTRPENGS